MILSNYITFQAQGPIEYFIRLFSAVYENPWVVLVELLLIGTVVYTTLRFLQGTRGARLIRGIVVVLVFSFVFVRMLAEKFQWERIVYLYQYFVGAVFLMTLIIFQPELRRGFMRIGEQSWLSGWFKKPSTLIHPIVESAVGLSKKRIGALIAIERVTGLAAIVETGVLLDAKISSELLNTIFWPGSALHDMGVIIRNEQIVAAGCQFPLAESGDIDRNLGSRHRAALGLSQESDAVIVVVSEETGNISVACNGRLHRSLPPETLAELLGSLMNRGRRASEEGPSLSHEDQAAA